VVQVVVVSAPTAATSRQRGAVFVGRSLAPRRRIGERHAAHAVAATADAVVGGLQRGQVGRQLGDPLSLMFRQ